MATTPYFRRLMLTQDQLRVRESWTAEELLAELWPAPEQTRTLRSQEVVAWLRSMQFEPTMGAHGCKMLEAAADLIDQIDP